MWFGDVVLCGVAYGVVWCDVMCVWFGDVVLCGVIIMWCVWFGLVCVVLCGVCGLAWHVWHVCVVCGIIDDPVEIRLPATSHR